MPKKTSEAPGPQESYWESRVRSKAFKHALKTLVVHELKALSAEQVKDVLDVELVRTMLREWDSRMIDREIVADLIIRENRRMADRLTQRDASLLGLLDPRLVADIDSLLDEDMGLSPHAEDFVATMMEQEFVRRLFTDIIFTAIVSFYQRVNPLFGAITMRVLEEQIKGFIRLFMPMLQAQATAFAVNKENQRIVQDFARSFIRQLLEQPVHHYAGMISAGQRKKAEVLIRHAVADTKLDAMMREATLAAWDDLYKTIRDKKVGDVLGLDQHAGWLAERSVDVILPLLTRPHVLRFIAAEWALAAPQR